MFPVLSTCPDHSRAWFDSRSGQRWRECESRVLADMLPRLTGYRCVALGPALPVAAQGRSPWGVATLRQWNGDIMPKAGTDFVYDGHHLPLASHSVDVVVLHHALELTTDPHGLIRECSRILSERGQLVALVYNPCSFWAMRQLPAVSGSVFLPRARPPRAARLTDWLRLVEMETVERRRYGLGLPLARRCWQRDDAQSWLAAMAWMAGGYALMARRHGLRRIPPGGQHVKTRRRPALAGAAGCRAGRAVS